MWLECQQTLTIFTVFKMIHFGEFSNTALTPWLLEVAVGERCSISSSGYGRR